MYKLPVWDTIAAVYKTLWTDKLSLFKYATLLLALFIFGPLLIALSTAGIIFTTAQISGAEAGRTTYALIRTLLAVFAPLVYAAVIVTFILNWHRHYLLGSQAAPLRSLLIWKRRNWIFIGRSAAILAIALIVMFFISDLTQLALAVTGTSPISNLSTFLAVNFFVPAMQSLVMASVLLLCVSALLPALPAAAIEDEDINLWKSIKITKNNRVNLSAAMFIGSVFPFWILPSIIENIILIIISRGPGYSMQEFQKLKYALNGNNYYHYTMIIFYIIGGATGISLLSECYRRLKNNVQLDREPEASE